MSDKEFEVGDEVQKNDIVYVVKAKFVVGDTRYLALQDTINTKPFVDVESNYKPVPATITRNELISYLHMRLMPSSVDEVMKKVDMYVNGLDMNVW